MLVYNFSVSEVYKKNPNISNKDIENLQEWAQTQLHLPKITEQQLILFLHSCDYNLEQTKITIEHFFTTKTKSAVLFDYIPPNKIKTGLSLWYFNNYIYKLFFLITVSVQYQYCRKKVQRAIWFNI